MGRKRRETSVNMVNKKIKIRLTINPFGNLKVGWFNQWEFTHCI